MRQLRYLNGVLTVIAVLLTINLYAAWHAAPLAVAPEAHAQGIPNAAAQRKEMTDLLKAIHADLAKVNKTMTDGSMRARVEAGDE